MRQGVSLGAGYMSFQCKKDNKTTRTEQLSFPPYGNSCSFSIYGSILDLYPDPFRAGRGTNTKKQVVPPQIGHIFRDRLPAASLIPYY